MSGQGLRRARPQGVPLLPIPAPGLLAGLTVAVLLAVLGPWVPGCGVAAWALCVLLTLRVIGEAWCAPGCLPVEQHTPSVLPLGEAAELQWRVHNPGEQAWRISVAEACPSALRPERSAPAVWVPPAGRQELRCRIRARGRGVYALGPAEVRMRRRFGLLEFRHRLDCEQAVRVCPRVPASVRAQVPARYRATVNHLRRPGGVPVRQGEFERLKDYVAGDDIRQLDWKATARLGRPIARVYGDERAQDLILALDTTRGMAGGGGSDTKLDRVIEAALGLSSVALAGGDRVGLMVFDRTVRSVLPPRSDRRQLGRLVELLTHPTATLTSANYRAAVHSLGRHQRRRALIVWLTDVIDEAQGVRLAKAVRSLTGRHLNLVVSLSEEGLEAPGGIRLTSSGEFFASVAAIEACEARDRLDEELRCGGAQVLNTPLPALAGALVARYQQVKRTGTL